MLLVLLISLKEISVQNCKKTFFRQQTVRKMQNRKGQNLVGWLILGISVYIRPSPKEREKEERKDR